ncbi:MAG: arsenic efflux protein [Deltaproteobacteria bacterium]|nr:arsenic efflux protein [Deltaproteobacteria bacterium]
MTAAIGVFHKALMITAFVSVMLLLVEYLNVQTYGALLRLIRTTRWRQYGIAALLGAVPGCLGAYAVVALYAHRKVGLGALVAAMIATSGDETFVMLALFPATALWMTAGLALLGVIAGWATDALFPVSWLPQQSDCKNLALHDQEDCRCFPRGEILAQWRPPSAYRATLVAGLALVLLTVLTGQLGPVAWGWKRITLALVMGLGLFVASTVPEHFLEDHLWRHVVLQHVPRIFLWTIGVLAVMAVIEHFVDLRSNVEANQGMVLLTASLVGVFPESGPHLAFVTMFADHVAPLSVLVASSIVQDGHGMLPLLASSKKAFFVVKLINLVVGIAVGFVLLALGF